MYKTEIFKNYSDFLNRSDKQANGVSEQFAKNNPRFAEDNQTNIGCWNCRACVGCWDCRNCHYCHRCRRCSYCRGCRGCIGFKSNPQRITSPAIGSRQTQTTYYWNREKGQIVCGCFRGSLSEFKTKVERTYGFNEGHGLVYLEWINSVENYIQKMQSI